MGSEVSGSRPANARPSRTARLAPLLFRRLRSATSGFSSFQHELVDMGRAIQVADARALVVVDEFGKGTSSLDGAAVFAAAVRHFALRVPGCRALFSTHFTEALDGAVLGLRTIPAGSIRRDAGGSGDPEARPGDSAAVGLYRMQVTFAAGDASPPASPDIAAGWRRSRAPSAGPEVVPLFRLEQGVSDGSFGI